MYAGNDRERSEAASSLLKSNFPLSRADRHRIAEIIFPTGPDKLSLTKKQIEIGLRAEELALTYGYGDELLSALCIEFDIKKKSSLISTLKKIKIIKKN